jgi:tRNA pseudouridine13 synthase
MPGRDPVEAKSEGELAIVALLEKYAVTAEDFRQASAFVHTRFDGAWRPVALKTDTGFFIEQNDVLLKFSLPPGHYATTVCREFMKTDPVQMI